MSQSMCRLHSHYTGQPCHNRIGVSSHVFIHPDVLYVPAVHAVHRPPSGPEEPVLHVQLVKAELPAGELEFVGQVMHVITATAVEYVPAPQSVQLADPVDVLYFPATHAVHVPPLGPV